MVRCPRPPRARRPRTRGRPSPSDPPRLPDLAPRRAPQGLGDAFGRGDAYHKDDLDDKPLGTPRPGVHVAKAGGAGSSSTPAPASHGHGGSAPAAKKERTDHDSMEARARAPRATQIGPRVARTLTHTS